MRGEGEWISKISTIENYYGNRFEKQVFWDILANLIHIKLTNSEKVFFSYYQALHNEIHTLATIIDMLNYVISQDQYLSMQGKNYFYIGTLFESNIRNLRSIFDFLSVVIRIAVKEEYRNRLPQEDSFNDFLKFIEKDAAKVVIPQTIIEIIIGSKPLFENIKDIRDLVIHKGKEGSFFKIQDQYCFNLETNNSKGNIAANILGVEGNMFPLIPYLSKLTNELLFLTNDLGMTLVSIIRQEDDQFEIMLSALEGVCIP